MNEVDREKLKSYFRNGALPTAEHYEQLIDSSVNKYDDGFAKDPDGGLRIASMGGQHGLLSFAKGAGGSVSWRLGHAGQEDLSLATGQADATGTPVPPSLVLTQSGPVGVNQAAPQYALDVGGPMRSAGRIGYVPEREADDAETLIAADGNWHAITPILDGCHALEVMAGVGGVKKSGHYALLHAIALNTYNPRGWIFKWLMGHRRIRQQTAVFGRYADRLMLRWKDVGKRRYKLMIRTPSDYGPAADGKPHRIRYSITPLWFDPEMESSRSDAVQDPVAGGIQTSAAREEKP